MYETELCGFYLCLLILIISGNYDYLSHLGRRMAQKALIQNQQYNYTIFLRNTTNMQAYILMLYYIYLSYLL